jgi:Tfp pilus assembly protein PilN
VAALAGVTPERAVLTALTLAPYEEQARRGGAEGEGPTSWLAIEISGVAPSDAEVASMVSGLEDHPLFAAVKLEFARSRDMDEALFREFRLRCEIDLSRQYLLVDAGEGEGVLP